MLFNTVHCESESLRIGDSIYLKTGNYRTILRGYLGCDSIVLTNLTVMPRRIKMIDTTICSNQTVIVNNKTYRLAGIYRDTIHRTSPLCDSILLITVKTKTLFYREQWVTLCKGETYKLYDKQYNQSGVFKDTFRFPNICDSVITTTVKIIDLQLIIDSPIEIKKGDSVQLNPSVLPLNSVKWQWSPNDGSLNCVDCPYPILRGLQTRLYKVFVQDTVSGCTETRELMVQVRKCDVFIPNAFSPNGDGNNDIFSISQISCAKRIKSMQIFNRWGGLVFRKENVMWKTEGWDGTFKGQSLVSDVYVCYVEVELGDGSVELFKGDVTLVR